MGALTVIKPESDEVVELRPDGERIAALEAQHESTQQQIRMMLDLIRTQSGEIRELAELKVQVARLAHAQEQSNKQRLREHDEGREDKRDAGYWVRWGFEKAVMAVGLLLSAYVIVMLGGAP